MSKLKEEIEKGTLQLQPFPTNELFFDKGDYERVTICNRKNGICIEVHRGIKKEIIDEINKFMYQSLREEYFVHGDIPITVDGDGRPIDDIQKQLEEIEGCAIEELHYHTWDEQLDPTIPPQIDVHPICHFINKEDVSKFWKKINELSEDAFHHYLESGTSSF